MFSDGSNSYIPGLFTSPLTITCNRATGTLITSWSIKPTLPLKSPFSKKSYTSSVFTTLLLRISSICLKDPSLLIPPAAYNALNILDKEDNVKVPGRFASPTIVILMLLMRPTFTSILL